MSKIGFLIFLLIMGVAIFIALKNEDKLIQIEDEFLKKLKNFFKK